MNLAVCEYTCFTLEWQAMREIFGRGRKIFTEPQSSVMSAAFVIMSMVVLSQVLGFVSKRILLSYFNPTEYAMFFAAFRLPDMLFEVLALGVFSSAFIPVVTATLKKNQKEAWDIASKVVNIGLIAFLPLAILFSLFALPLYSIIAAGFSEPETVVIASVARILFMAQGVFVVSYVVTGVLESSRRFFIPALAPLFYNLGIIVTTVLFTPQLGLYAPALGVVIGAFAHLGIQLPFVYRLGFRFSRKTNIDAGVKKVGKLAAPRMLELGILQLLKTSELFFASLISTASYTYLTLAGSLQAFPVTLLGVSLAKAALPTLTRQADDHVAFRKTFLSTLNQMMFFVIPIASTLVVLRVPAVRLLFGADKFDWQATIQTGLALSAYAIGIPLQAALMLISRAFYALHDTKTPVKFAIVDVLLTIVIQVICVFVLHLPVWSLALANTVSGAIQIGSLYVLLARKLHDGALFSIAPIAKSLIAAMVSGGAMFMILKTFDRSVWVKRLSFMNTIDMGVNFERFVLDTRYTGNLIVLTVLTALAGVCIYLFVSALLQSEELWVFIKVIKGRAFPRPARETEPINTPTQNNTL